MDLTANSNYYTGLTDLYDRDGECLLRGTEEPLI